MPIYPDDPSQFTMNFGDHLEELRRRLLYALAAPFVLFIPLFFISDALILILLRPAFRVLQAQNLAAELQVLSVQEMILLKLKVAGITGLVATGPWLIYQMWQFIAPGLYIRERRFVHLLIPGSTILTISGVMLMYFVMLPLMLHVLVQFGTGLTLPPPNVPDRIASIIAETDQVPIRLDAPEDPVAGAVWLQFPDMFLFAAIGQDDGTVVIERVPSLSSGRIRQAFRVSFVINFTLLLMLGIVIAFQMPLVVVLLGWLGLVSESWLRAPAPVRARGVRHRLRDDHTGRCHIDGRDADSPVWAVRTRHPHAPFPPRIEGRRRTRVFRNVRIVGGDA